MFLFKFDADGTPYKAEHGFTCQVQVAAFKSLIEGMSAHPQHYVSDHGRLTTNTVEGFHGLALVYRDKRTDLCHTHYTCKTNMAICHKVIGNIGLAVISNDFFKWHRTLVPSGRSFVLLPWVWTSQ